MFSCIFGWVCTGDGKKAAFGKGRRSRGRPTPISPLVVSFVFAAAKKLIPLKKTDIRLYPA